MFNFKKSFIFKIAKLKKISFSFRYFFLFSLILLFFLENRYLLKLSIVLFSLGLFFWQLDLFIHSKSRINFQRKDKTDDLFDLESCQALNEFLKGKKSLIKCLLDESSGIRFVFLKMDINSWPEKETNLDQVINLALEKASMRGRNKATSGDLFLALTEIELKEKLFQENLNQQDISDLIYWLEEKQKKESFWDLKKLKEKGSLAGDWAFGYTVTLDKFSVDWTNVLRKKKFPELVGHEKEIKDMERILSRREINNVLLIGERGIGKTNMIYELAKRSFGGESLPEVNHQRVVEIDMASLLAQAENNEEVEVLLNDIFQEVVSSGNIILVIPDFESYIGVKQEPGKVNITSVLAPYLHLPQFQVVALTDPAGYRESIEKISAVDTFFEKIEVKEASDKETLSLLMKMSFSLEKKYKIIIPYSALKAIINYCEKYLTSAFFPKKAMDILDEASIYLSQKKEKKLLPSHVAEIISLKIDVPVGETSKQEKEILLDLESRMHERIVNQEKAVSEISSALRRARAEVSQGLRPMGSFLFLGPTGVGKTETAKALNECYFGSNKKIIRLDMSEFQNLSDIDKMIGSTEYQGFLTSQVRENPFSLVLIDEIEKAHPDILNVFLQILDEGYVNDGLQRKVDFRNAIIIATSNAGSQFITENVEKDWSKIKQELLDVLFQDNIFRPELINRFDSVVVFEPLTQENLLEIAEMILKQVALNMEKKGITFVYDLELKKSLVEISYSPKFGARELKRAVQDKVENVLASAILADEIKKGDKVGIERGTFRLLTF